MKLSNIALLAVGFATGSVNAADFSFIGNLTNDDEVQEFNFTVAGDPATVTLFTSSFAGGLNMAGMQIQRGGFDPVVSLFDSNGTNIAVADDGSYSLDFDPPTYTEVAHDSVLVRNLSAGSYTATLSQAANYPWESLTGYWHGTELGTHFSDRDSHWSLDIRNVNTATVGAIFIPPIIPPVSEPETYAMLLAGLGLLGWRLRRAQNH